VVVALGELREFKAVLDTKHLKAQGLRFGRSFQMALRTSVMFSPDHPSLERPLEQSFNLLNEVLKQTGQFTIGFVDNQVLINSVLTTESGLAQLQKEFLKRGIAALTFEPGLTLGRYRRIVSVLSAPASVIEQAGGIREYLELNEIQGGRIVAASRNQKKTESGDTLIETDSEAFILSKQMAEEGPRDFMESLDALLESGCIDPATRNAALAGLSAGNPNLFGQGIGVPITMPDSGETTQQSGHGTGVGGTGFGLGGNGTGIAGSGGSSGDGSGGPGFGGGPGSFVGVADASHTASPVPNGYVITAPAGDAKDYTPASAGSYRTFMDLVEDSVGRSLIEDKGNPRKSYLSLARILKESRLDTVLAHFPAERREELKTLPPEQLAAEYVEESTLKLISKKLNDINKASGDKYIIEEDVLRLLARSLQATHMADRLAFKLAKFFQDYSVPQNLQKKIQDELRWTALTPKNKLQQLLQTPRYDFTQFRRLIEFIKELMQQREPEKVVELTVHYFAFLDDPAVIIEAEELSRSIELLRTTKFGREPETNEVVERLGRVLMRQEISELLHFQAANNLSILAQSSSVFEAFDKVLLISEALRQSLARNPEQHQKCCQTGLSRMLAPTAIERLIELYIANRSDANLARSAAAILRHSHPAGTEAVLQFLVDEKNASNRIALMRLISHIGPACVETARKLLLDDRWYVVRNMCNLLADLQDPELTASMAKPLTHADERVQQAALKALIKNRAQGRSALIAQSLTEMAPSVADPALDEVLYLRSPECVPGLQRYVSADKTPSVMARKALQILISIPGDESTAALQQIAGESTISMALRQTATETLNKRQVPITPAQQAVAGQTGVTH
jgi:hypothetical protein